jgi:hypothetical protein
MKAALLCVGLTEKELAQKYGHNHCALAAKLSEERPYGDNTILNKGRLLYSSFMLERGTQMRPDALESCSVGAGFPIYCSLFCAAQWCSRSRD